MGRPRKRPRDESDGAAAPTEGEANNNKAPMIHIPPDTQDPGLAFLSFLSGGEFDFDASLPTGVLENSDSLANKAPWEFGYTGNDFGALNFDTAVEHAPSFSTSNLDPALFVSADTPPEAVPKLSSAASSSPSSSGSPPNLGAANCACTASLYLAIDSMQRLPTDVTEAVRQARIAAKTAHDVVNCPMCHTPLQPATVSPCTTSKAMQNFQNLMLLATLIPSTVHAYERILHIVDLEAAKAQAERREIAFTLDGYGGMWGGLGKEDVCGTSQMLNNRMMEPIMWRLTVRALLRVDVYGISGDCCESSANPRGSDSEQPEPFHLGLKDVVDQMENRSKARHAIMDHMMESGAWPDPSCALKLHKTGETPTCQRIIQIARLSLDNLVIA